MSAQTCHPVCFLNWGICFLTIELSEFFIFFRQKHFGGYMVYKHSLPVCELPFHIYNNIFWGTNVKLWWIQIYQFDLSFMIWVFGGIYKQECKKFHPLKDYSFKMYI